MSSNKNGSLAWNKGSWWADILPNYKKPNFPGQGGGP
jgi:hypothetical protein